MSLKAITGISIEYIFGHINMENLISNLDPEEDLQTSQYCYRIIHAFFHSNYTYSKVIIIMMIIR